MRQYTRFMLRTITLCLATALIANASNAQTILVHGHRGSRATRPENTIPAFEYAIQHSADVLELDLAVTKDNVLVVSHLPFITPDYLGERVFLVPTQPPHTAFPMLALAPLEHYDCGANTLTNFPKQMAVPGTHIPTFEQVLDLAPQGKFYFNVE